MNHRPEPLTEVADRAERELVAYLAAPTGRRLAEREREALTRGRTFLRRLAAHRGASVRAVLAQAERIRLERGELSLAMAIEAVLRTGSLSELLTDGREHARAWARLFAEDPRR